MATAYSLLLPRVNNRAKLDGAASGSVVKGQPVEITTFSTASTDPVQVKITADGSRPDAIVTDAVEPGGLGLVQPRCFGPALVLLGGSVAKGDWLKVSGGRFVKGTVGDNSKLQAMQAGASGDLINAEPV